MSERTHPDLFGGETPIVTTTRGDTAHAAPMGSGPEGRTCGDCANLRVVDYHDARYFKCWLIKATHGPGTDIRKKDAACYEFKESP